MNKTLIAETTTETHAQMTDDEIGTMLDELCYRSYKQQRILFPHVEPTRWELIYGDVELMETRYRVESF